VGFVNQRIADYIFEAVEGYGYGQRTVLVARTVGNGLLRRGMEERDFTVVSEGSSSYFGAGERKYDAWESLATAREILGEGGIVMIVTQAFLAGRALAQAKKLGLRGFLPPDLPTDFDRRSAQSWCRSRWAWARREVMAVTYLRAVGRL
jgi:hypothetical protein